MRLKTTLAAAAVAVMGTATAMAQPGQGPVAQSCQDDIAKFCAGLAHGQGAVRRCLTENKAKVTEACRHALDTTGPGMGGGMGMGRGMGGGMGR